MFYIFYIPKLTAKSQRRVTPFLPSQHQCSPIAFTSCHVYFCLFCFIFNVSFLVFLLPPPSLPLSHRTHLVFSLLDQIRQVQLWTPGRGAIKKKKRKVRESFRRSSRLPYVQRNAYSTSQKTRGIQLYQTSRSAIIHPDITPLLIFPLWLCQIHHQLTAFKVFNPSLSPSAIHSSVCCSLPQLK